MNNLFGMIWPNVAAAFGVFLLKGFFDSTPDALREASRIEGAGEVRTFLQILLPIVKPGIGAVKE
ncbi:Binding-protein-dependent transport system inner membrane component [Paenibacillus sp. cl141a]|uniref:ABC transporter permease subunit n=1 Tax=Paenibacillus sp. cl141a TaxID=1761877 RepID=UPI0008C728D8|nr:ABC transporter permease subunit [Paenibacillus sp. cl141a]SEL48055.1 Binding-protein-dependent transport system inner membrane component [Paenibacillus sp. cl141a]